MSPQIPRIFTTVANMTRLFRLRAMATLTCLLLIGPLLHAQETKGDKPQKRDKPSVSKDAPKESAPAAKKKKKKPSHFLRVRKNENGQPLAMETSIVTYKSAGKKNKGVTVYLVGAVHIGEKDYYQRLNRAFTKYEVLLYELVAPEGTRIPKGGRRKKGGGSVIGSIQTSMKDVLGLEFQLEQVDYTKKNFVHADMSPTEFDKSMKDKGESWLQMFFRMMGQSMAMQSSRGSSDLELMMAFLSKDKTRLKRIMASQFEDMETAISGLEGPNGSTILTERNKKCLEVLEKQIAAGKKKIGIFYGAAHLPDMESRLVKDFGLKRTKVKWMPAWNLSGTKKPAKKSKSSKSPKSPKASKAKTSKATAS